MAAETPVALRHEPGISEPRCPRRYKEGHARYHRVARFLLHRIQCTFSVDEPPTDNMSMPWRDTEEELELVDWWWLGEEGRS